MSILAGARTAGSLMKKAGSGKFIAPAFFVGDAALNMSAGDDIGTAAIKSAGTSIIAASNPVLFTGLTLAPLAGQGFVGYQDLKQRKQDFWNTQYAGNNTVGGNFQDTQRAQTMRQAAVQAIQGSKMNARSALGGEAKIMNPYASRTY